MQRQFDDTNDSTLKWIVCIFAVVSIVCTGIFLYAGDTLAYVDAQSHLLISRRIVDNITPGYSQNGCVWQDIPHLLAAPFTRIGVLYTTGLAGTYFPMISFVLSIVYLYKMVTLRPGWKVAGIYTAVVFGTNPNVLYMQSTAMTELPMLCTFIMATYYLLSWSMKPEVDSSLDGIEKRPNWVPLCLAGVCISVGSHIRYEAWMLFPVMGLAILYVCIRLRWDFWKTLSHLILFGFSGSYGIFLWLYFNWRIFRDPLRFMRGEYAAPSNWVQSSDPAVGNFTIALKTYGYAIALVVGWPILTLSLLGLVFFIYNERFAPQSAPMLTLLFPLFFFPPMLYLAQRPMHVPEINGSMYNVRFALAMQLPVALMAGYLVHNRMWARRLVQIAILLTIFSMVPGNIITLQEPNVAQASIDAEQQREATEWLKSNYSGGLILMEGYGNESINFGSELSTSNFIYEGTYGYWERALVNPNQFVDWLVMRTTPGDEDKVFKEYLKHPNRFSEFTIVWQGENITICQKKDG